MPTHLRFIGGPDPELDGGLPRNYAGAGVMMMVAGMKELLESSPVKMNCVQIPVFLRACVRNCNDLIEVLRALGNLEARGILNN